MESRAAWWAWGLLAVGVVCAAPVFGQTVPEIQRPRSENPLVDGGGRRPVPDTGVITPPPTAGAPTPVIRPPVAGTMPVIPPPGSPGGDRMLVPK